MDNKVNGVCEVGGEDMLDWWGEPFDQDAEEEEEGEGDLEEAQKPKYKVVSDRPLKKDVLEHMVTHMPCRDWCPHCVRGKSKSCPQEGPG